MDQASTQRGHSMISSHVLARIIAPIIFFVCAGYLSKRLGKCNSEQGGTLISFVMNIAIPCMIITDLNGQPLSNYLHYVTFFSAFLLITVFMFAISLLYARLIKKHGALIAFYFAASASLSNTCMIALPILVLLMPKQGATFGVLGIIVLIFGLQAMSFIYQWSRSQDHQGKPTLTSTLSSFGKSMREPYFIALGIGIILSVFSITLPVSLNLPLQGLGSTTGPIALFAIGIQLDFSAFKGHFRTVVECCLLKLIVMPVIAWFFCKSLGMSPITTIAVVICSAVASAKCQYALAKQNNIYVKESAAIVAATTTLSFISLSIIISLLYNKY